MEATIGALVRYCGHKAVFIADLIPVGTAVVVRASVSIEKVLNRDQGLYAEATHHVMDFPKRGFWRPELGTLVVPSSQVLTIKRKVRQVTP